MSTFPWKNWIPGALNDSQINSLIEAGYIENAAGCTLDYSAFDLRLEDKGFEMIQGSMKPWGAGYAHFLESEPHYSKRLDRPNDRIFHLQAKNTYVFALQERLSARLKGSNIHGQATAKSSVGRVDVLARLIVDGMHSYEGFDSSRMGSGTMFLEITPITFPVKVKVGESLSQLRLFYGPPAYCEIVGPELCAAVLIRDDNEKPDTFLRVDLSNADICGHSAAAFKAEPSITDPVSLWVEEDANKKPINRPNPAKFWDFAVSQNNRLRITEKNFYILRSKERIVLPRGVCVYCRAIDETIGEMRIHYAGFVHPYFGVRIEEKDPPGTPLIFEVRGHDVNVVLNDGEILARLQFYRMSQDCEEPPDRKKLSPYNNQILQLSKFFDEFKN